MVDIVIVPTSHIAEQSIRAVERVISREKPDCVAVELDFNRFILLESGETPGMSGLRQLGPWTYLMLFLMKRVQGWLGKKVGIMPGSDMLKAVRTAERRGYHVEFIDRDIALTLGRLKGVTWREKAKLFLFLLKGLTIDSALARAGRSRQTAIDLRKVPPRKVIDEAISVLRKEFPGIHRVLVSERDSYMARRLLGLSQFYGKIVAVVGAAHAPGLLRILGNQGT
jgi:pheromone shutdown protein TraB